MLRNLFLLPPKFTFTFGRAEMLIFMNKLKVSYPVSNKILKFCNMSLCHNNYCVGGPKEDMYVCMIWK